MMQAMIFAAGLGTRLKPLTDTMPKALVRVGSQPLLKHVIDRLAAAGCSRIVVNVHHFASQITGYLAHNACFGLDIRVSDESARLLDTGGGIRHALPLFDSTCPVLVHNVDILSDVDLRAFYDAAKGGDGNAAPDALLLVSERVTTRYLLFDDSMRLVGWTNVKTGEVRTPFERLDVSRCRRYAFAGIHVMSQRLLAMTASMPDVFPIIDFYLSSCASADIRGWLKSDLRLMDVGKADTLAEAEAFLQSLSAEPHMPRSLRTPTP